MVGNPAKKIGWVSTKDINLMKTLFAQKQEKKFYLDGEILRKK